MFAKTRIKIYILINHIYYYDMGCYLIRDLMKKGVRSAQFLKLIILIWACTNSGYVLSTESVSILVAVNDCWQNAEKLYGTDRYLLMAIAERESAYDADAINRRSDKDEDVGLMQINTFWFPHLKKFGITRDDLFEPCVSIHVGAWVLAQSLQEFDDYWQGVGAYNIGTSKSNWAMEARQKYANDIFRRYARLLKRVR